MDRLSEAHLSSLYSEHIALELGQQEPPDEWPTPEGKAGTTMVTSEVHEGEVYDPPLVTVHVYSGMAFRDTVEKRIVTFEKAQWFAWAEDGERDWTDPRDPVKCRFDAPEEPIDPDYGPLNLSGDQFARFVANGRYENVTDA